MDALIKDVQEVILVDSKHKLHCDLPILDARMSCMFVATLNENFPSLRRFSQAIRFFLNRRQHLVTEKCHEQILIEEEKEGGEPLSMFKQHISSEKMCIVSCDFETLNHSSFREQSTTEQHSLPHQN